MTSQGKDRASSFSQGLTLKVITEMLNIKEDARKELLKCDSNDFDIFRLRHLTDGCEMEAIHSFIMVRRNCVSKTNVDINKMFNFISSI